MTEGWVRSRTASARRSAHLRPKKKRFSIIPAEAAAVAIKPDVAGADAARPAIRSKNKALEIRDFSKIKPEGFYQV